MPDLYSNVHLIIRWLHVLAGIVWIGHLYFFNFVNVPLQGTLDDATKKSVNPQLLPRALWWFRWGAMVTLLAGLILFVMNYFYVGDGRFGPTSLLIDPLLGRITHRAMWIFFGMILGIIMWFNVWFVIWPAQKALLTGKVPADKAPAVRKRALLFSRTNTYLSGPMLFGMLAPAHYGAMSFPSLLLAILLGVIAIWASIRSSGKVGKLK
ncbi:MAG: urate hydroxylase PuuD [Candidatus Omnitrophica bacterium]|nr:urate hydroxylase PuuD [Candidatus Omnitrophota bacterium]